MTAVGKFARLQPAERVLVLEAYLLLAVFRVALWILPWRRVFSFVGSLAVSGSPRFSVERLEWAVRAMSRVVPRATCLVQALALDRLLSRNGYAASLQIGVRKGARFEAHAWIEHDRVTLLSSAGEVAQYSRLIGWDSRPSDRPR